MPAEQQEQMLSDAAMDKIEALEVWAADNGHSLLELAFAWLLAHPVVPTVIAGATKAEQVRTNAEAASWSLSSAQLDEVDDVLGRASGSGTGG
jgi:aryl-alcohol dehydrogenase-like predicted oxidoreductase